METKNLWVYDLRHLHTANLFCNFFFEIPDEAILRGHIMDYNIKVSTILMPEATASASSLPFYDHISGAMNGRAHTVHHDGNIMDFYVSLNEAFADILHSEAMYPTEIPELGKQELQIIWTFFFEKDCTTH